MPFELYFSIQEIRQRIPRSASFFRSEIQRGAFGEVASILVVDGSYFVPLSGVEFYLRAHSLAALPVLAPLVAERLRPALEARGIFSNGTPARDGGELKRKLAKDGPNHG